MDKEKDSQPTETISDFLVQMLKEDEENLESTREYLLSMFLSSAIDALFYARRKAGLTQEQLAQKLGKKQSAIARWEADVDGKMSLRQYVEIAQACGVTPFAMALEPLEALRNFVLDNPEVLPTQELYLAWMKRTVEPLQISLPVTGETFTIQEAFTATPETNTTIPIHEGRQAVIVAEQILKEQRQANEALMQLLDDNATSTIHRSQLPNAYRQEADRIFSPIDQEKVAA
jgi:transcriptional regulator with XRE-family HTH domain